MLLSLNPILLLSFTYHRSPPDIKAYSMSTASPPQMMSWEFNDRGLWYAYSVSDQAAIEKAFISSFSQPSIKPFAINHETTISFNTMMHTNNKTKYSRPIRRVAGSVEKVGGNTPATTTTTTTGGSVTSYISSFFSSAPSASKQQQQQPQQPQSLSQTPSAKWYFLDDSNDWILCQRAQQDSLIYEQLFQQAISAQQPITKLQVVIKSENDSTAHNFQLDFNNMTQTNTGYNTTRSIRRVPLYPFQAFPPQQSTQLNQKVVNPTPFRPQIIKLSPSAQQYSDYLKARMVGTNTSGVYIKSRSIYGFGDKIERNLNIKSKADKHIARELKSLNQAKKSYSSVSFTAMPLSTWTDSSTFFDSTQAIYMDLDHYLAYRDVVEKSGDVRGFLNYYSPSQKNPQQRSITHNMTSTGSHTIVNLDHSITTCPICQCDLWDVEQEDDEVLSQRFPLKSIIHLSCSHVLHTDCLKSQLKNSGGSSHSGSCSICKEAILESPGPQPDGTCTVSFSKSQDCPGHSGIGSITMSFNLRAGVQDSRHANPGVSYSGDTRTHHMPQTPYVMDVLLPLFVKAFLTRHLFTVGYSFQRSQDNVITYSSIHLKTDMAHGASHGYPDQDFEKIATGEVLDCGIIMWDDELP